MNQDPLYNEIINIIHPYFTDNMGIYFYNKLLNKDDNDKITNYYYGYKICEYNYKICGSILYIYDKIDPSIFIPLLKKILINNHKNIRNHLTIYIIYQNKYFKQTSLLKYFVKHSLLYLLDKINPKNLTYYTLIHEQNREKRATIIYKEKTKLQDAFIEAFYRGNR